MATEHANHFYFRVNCFPFDWDLPMTNFHEVIPHGHKIPEEKKEYNWNQWSEDIDSFFSKNKFHPEKKDVTTVSGRAPGPVFVKLGIFFSRSHVDYVVTFDEDKFGDALCVSKEEDIPNQTKPIEIELHNIWPNGSDVDKKSLVQLNFTHEFQQKVPPVSKEVDLCLNIVAPKKGVSFGWMTRNLQDCLRKIYGAHPKADFVVVSKFINKYNFALGSIWSENVFGKIVMYHEGEKVDMKF